MRHEEVFGWPAIAARTGLSKRHLRRIEKAGTITVYRIKHGHQTSVYMYQKDIDRFLAARRKKSSSRSDSRFKPTYRVWWMLSVSFVTVVLLVMFQWRGVSPPKLTGYRIDTEDGAARFALLDQAYPLREIPIALPESPERMCAYWTSQSEVFEAVSTYGLGFVKHDVSASTLFTNRDVGIAQEAQITAIEIARGQGFDWLAVSLEIDASTSTVFLGRDLMPIRTIRWFHPPADLKFFAHYLVVLNHLGRGHCRLSFYRIWALLQEKNAYVDESNPILTIDWTDRISPAMVVRDQTLVLLDSGEKALEVASDLEVLCHRSTFNAALSYGASHAKQLNTSSD